MSEQMVTLRLGNAKELRRAVRSLTRALHSLEVALGFEAPEGKVELGRNADGSVKYSISSDRGWEEDGAASSESQAATPDGTA
jgi:hypothetical protein